EPHVARVEPQGRCSRRSQHVLLGAIGIGAPVLRLESSLALSLPGIDEQLPWEIGYGSGPQTAGPTEPLHRVVVYDVRSCGRVGWTVVHIAQIGDVADGAGAPRLARQDLGHVRPGVELERGLIRPEHGAERRCGRRRDARVWRPAKAGEVRRKP